MKIIDKNNDFYDYLQYQFNDNYYLFDRRDSYNLSKEEFMKYFYKPDYIKNGEQPVGYIMLDIGSMHYNLRIEFTKFSDKYEEYAIDYRNFVKRYACLGYKLKLVNSYRIDPVELINLSIIEGITDKEYSELTLEDDLNYINCDIVYNATRAKDKTYNENYDRYHHIVYKVLDNFITDDFDNNCKRIVKHIPILQNIGLGCLDHREVYLAIEDYFAKQKTSQERWESVGITDKEKVINHGFDTKTSFRGKNK